MNIRKRAEQALDDIENEPDDDGTEDDQFSIAIDDSLLTEALAAVEMRMGRTKRAADIDLGPLDLDALAAVESERAIEVEEEPQEANLEQASASVAARLRAMEAEEEAEHLQQRLAGLTESREQSEQKAQRLTERDRRATEAQRAAERRAQNLKQALEKQQNDVSNLLERRKREKIDEFHRGRSVTLNAVADVIDNFFLALGHDQSDPEKLLEGVRMCLNQFQTHLNQAGIETIAPRPGDAFDPEKHEAMATETADGIEPGCIASLMSRGYMADGRLIRAARVAVAEE